MLLLDSKLSLNGVEELGTLQSFDRTEKRYEAFDPRGTAVTRVLSLSVLRGLLKSAE